MYLSAHRSASSEIKKDVLLPFVCDPRFPPDTLFVLAEGDFRFYEADCLGDECGVWPASTVKKEVGDSLRRAREEVAGAPASSSTTAAAADAAGAARSSGPEGPVADRGLQEGAGLGAEASAPPPQLAREQEDGPDLLTVLRTPRGKGRGGAESQTPPAVTSETQSRPRLFRESQPPPRSSASGAEPDASPRSESTRSFFGLSPDLPLCKPSMEVLDIVHIASTANRMRKGNFIWYA